jgi:hypothetical protein
MYSYVTESGVDNFGCSTVDSQRNVEESIWDILCNGRLIETKPPKLLDTDQEFDPDRFGREPYLLWVDMEAFKASTEPLQWDLGRCRYQKVWKFKTVDRMRIFLKRSLASEYIRTGGTHFVVLVTARDSKQAIVGLSQSDVIDKLGMIVVIANKQSFFQFRKLLVGNDVISSSDTCLINAVQSRTVIVSSWNEAISALVVWRETLGRRRILP